MPSETAQVWITIATSLVILVIVAIAYHNVERTRGRQWVPHAVYFGCAILLIIFLPTSIAKYVFSALSVTFMGTLFPIYESGTFLLGCVYFFLLVNHKYLTRHSLLIILIHSPSDLYPRRAR